MNDDMRVSVSGHVEATVIDDGLRAVAFAGFARVGRAVLLRRYVRRLDTAPTSNAYGVEQWVNDVHLEAARPATDPSWRLEVIRGGLALVEALLPRMASLSAGYPAQAVLSLQSSPLSVDPDANFATGNVKFVLVRDDADDARTVGSWSQPVMAITIRPSGVVATGSSFGR